MPSRRMPGPRAEPPLGRRYWAAYFDAIATGELLLKPHTAPESGGGGRAHASNLFIPKTGPQSALRSRTSLA
jgi:hypothetical protein